MVLYTLDPTIILSPSQIIVLLVILEIELLKTVRLVVIILSQPLKASKVSEYTPVES